MNSFIKHFSSMACAAILMTPDSHMSAEYLGAPFYESEPESESEFTSELPPKLIDGEIGGENSELYAGQYSDLNDGYLSDSYREHGQPYFEQEASRTFDIVAEVLYWRPTLCGLEGAFGDTSITTQSSNDIVTTTIVESDKKPTSQWDPGFRLCLALGQCGFDFGLDWTHFNGNSHFSQHDQHGKWKIKYDSFDLKWGCYFSASPCLSFTPFIGLRGLEIYQKLHSHLESSLVTSSGKTEILTDQREKENFRGIGPEIGLYMDWKVAASFKLFGELEVVSYYGKVNGKNRCKDDFQGSRITNKYKKTSRSFNTIGTDAKIGMRWDQISYCSCNGERRITLALGLEQHRIYDFSNMGSDGNLSLDGGFFAAGFTLRY